MKYYAIFEHGNDDPIQTWDDKDEPFYTEQQAKDYVADLIECYGPEYFVDYEVRLWKDILSRPILTTAPVDYDGFGTREIRQVGTDGRKVYRLVDVQNAHLVWQCMRYESGMHIAWDEEQWEKNKDLIRIAYTP